MIADIFCPIFTLTITILACFIRRKSKIAKGFAYTRSPRHRSGPPGGLKSPPRPTASIIFGFAKTRRAHIFSVLSLVSAKNTFRNVFKIKKLKII